MTRLMRAVAAVMRELWARDDRPTVRDVRLEAIARRYGFRSYAELERDFERARLKGEREP